MNSLFRRTIPHGQDYFIATYYIKSKTNLRQAAWELAIGQSVGNPNVRNSYETDDLFENHSCIILEDEKLLSEHSAGIVKIAFPVINTNWADDGISHLLCQLMGGQLDIDTFESCRLKWVSFPQSVEKYFKGPKYGAYGIRSYTKQEDATKPLLGAILKPKTGISPSVLLDMVKELVDGGVNFIKEDEILSNPSFCPLEKRVELVSNYLAGRGIVYCHCINGDPHCILERAKFVANNGGNGIHINFWCGLGVYNSIRQLDLPLFVHFQKSGDKILTDSRHHFSIDWEVICDLAGLMGVDTIHAGMWGGYAKDSDSELRGIMNILSRRNVMPALSCGMHPGLVRAVNRRVGSEYIANTGGAIHGHPNGTTAGTKAMRQAIDGNHQEEYFAAINKFGLVN